MYLPVWQGGIYCNVFRGAVLLMGGITFNVWVAALFYDPVEKHLKKVPKNVAEKEENTNEDNDTSQKPKFMISTEDNSTSLYHLNEREAFLANPPELNNSFIRSASSAAVPNYKSYGGGRERKISVPTSRGELSRARLGNSKNQLSGSSTLHVVLESNNAMDMYSHSRLPSSRKVRENPPRRSPSTSSFQYVSTPYHGSTLTLQPETFASSFSLKAGSCLHKQDDKEDDPTKKSRFFDISLLRDPLYLVILISNSTSAIGYTNFIILLPSYAGTLGFDKTKGALLLSIVSALDLVGRIGGSALSDVNLIPKEWYFIGGLLVSGISLAALPFMETYAMLGLFCAIFGLASGVYVGITAVIMADLLGTERLQSSYGISLFVNGVLQLIGPPICGVWFENIKTYVPIFFCLGIVLVAGSACWGIVPFIKKAKQRVEKPSEVESP